MISHIKGIIRSRTANSLIVEVNGIGIEVYIPACVFTRLNNISDGEEIELFTELFLQLDRSKLNPILIGFLTTAERDFFDRLMSVAGIGPKMAMKALAMPVQEIALAIERGDSKLISTLPGIGKDRSRQIIAGLQGKVKEFCVEYARSVDIELKLPSSFLQNLHQLMHKLGYSPRDASKLIQEIMAKNPEIKTEEEFLQALFQK